MFRRRRPAAQDQLEKLPAAAGLQGRRHVTAGNACPLNDGAAAVVVMAEERARELEVSRRPGSRERGLGIDPEIMGVGPIEAVRQVLERPA